MKKTITTLVSAALIFATAAILQTQARAETASPDPVSESNILRDPEIPVLGNAKGDITVIEYFDYQCPYCKKFNPDLMKIVQEDGHIRLIFKDWPIFGNVSVSAAKLVLATKYQNKYAEAHQALISMTEKLSEDNLQNALVEAGVDVERARRDLASNRKTIDALLARNHEQAMAFGFQGTPSFIIGHFRVPGVLDPKNFKRAIAEARTAAKKK